jgi:hypothetical protein
MMKNVEQGYKSSGNERGNKQWTMRRRKSDNWIVRLVYGVARRDELRLKKNQQSATALPETENVGEIIEI